MTDQPEDPMQPSPGEEPTPPERGENQPPTEAGKPMSNDDVENLVREATDGDPLESAKQAIDEANAAVDSVIGSNTDDSSSSMTAAEAAALAAVQAAVAQATSGKAGQSTFAQAPDASRSSQPQQPPGGQPLTPTGGSPAHASQPGSAFTPPILDDFKGGGEQEGIDLLDDIDLNVKIELGRTRMLIDDVLKLGEGAVVELDKLAGDPVDVFVNNRHVARGEVLVLNDNFCVRISEIMPATSLTGERCAT